jgi:hypothetical protein
MRRFLLANRGIVAILLTIYTVIHSTLYIRHIGLHIDIFSTRERQVETFDFQDTAQERGCFDSTTPSPAPIPNVVHVIWLKKPDMTFISYLALRSVLVSLNPDELKFHYTSVNENNVWFHKLRDSLTLVHHDLDLEYPNQIQQKWQVSHLADALRLDVLQEEGGIYLDTDVIALRSFDNLMHCEKNVVLGHEGGDRHGLCNGVILGRKNSPFFTRWIDSYSNFANDEWNYHSVILPKKLALEYSDEVCLLSPTVFFWPTWTEKHIHYMHESINESEAEDLQDTINANGGSLYRNQLAYHAWSQVAWSPYLQHLTPELVKERNTRFNVMVRRFIE